jgi:hypothetical protein
LLHISLFQVEQVRMKLIISTSWEIRSSKNVDYTNYYYRVFTEQVQGFL